MTTTRTWHKGPPPHVGWWNARIKDGHDLDRWGWWDGKGWSTFAFETMNCDSAVWSAKERGGVYDGPGVEWSEYYPPGARVPRINPGAPA